MKTTWNIFVYSSVNYYINRKGACCNVSSKFFFSARPINIYWRASWLSCRRPLLVPTFQSYFLSCSHPILSFTLFPHSQDISTPWNISKSQNIFVLAKYFHTIPFSCFDTHSYTIEIFQHVQDISAEYSFLFKGEFSPTLTFAIMIVTVQKTPSHVAAT